MRQERSLKKAKLARLESLRADRSPYELEWGDSCDFVMGVRSSYLRKENGRKHNERNESLFNEEALFANTVLASGMMAGITSPARPWFNLATPDPDMMEFAPVKDWLADVQRRMYQIFSRSNFYRSMNEVYWEMGMFGVAPLGEYRDFDTIARFDNYTAGSYFLGMGANREIDTLYREYSSTVGAVVKRFGLENCSDTVKRLYGEHNDESVVKLIHAIEPNDKRRYGSALSEDMPYSSCYFEHGQDGDKMLLKSGFQSKPFMAPRWHVTGEDVYPIIYPAANSMGTNKSLQVEELDKATAIEKMHNPPLVGDSALDGFLDLVPGGVSFAPNMATAGKPALMPIYDVNPYIGDLSNDIREKENRIKRHFFADLFLMISDMDRAQITATEIAERKEEKLLMLGPVLERLNNELLDPVIDRTFELAQAAGILPPPPRELEGVDLRVDYVSVLAQAQRAISTASMESTAAFAANLGSIDPGALDKIDVDQMVDEYARAKGAPSKTVRSDSEVAKIRQQRQQQQAVEDQANRMASIVDGAQKMGNTPVDQGTALDGVLDAIGGQG